LLRGTYWLSSIEPWLRGPYRRLSSIEPCLTHNNNVVIRANPNGWKPP
jgi:hypothetical protein